MSYYQSFIKDFRMKLGRPLTDKEISFLQWVYTRHLLEQKVEMK